MSMANAQIANSSSASNITQCPTPSITGFFYKEGCKLICRETHWTDILLFYLGNYAAHAATVVSKPGQSPLASFIAIITALLFPGGGIRNGVDTIMGRAKWGKTNLQIACRAGAICAVVRVDPRVSDVERQGGGSQVDNSEPGGVESLHSRQREAMAAYNSVLSTMYGSKGQLPRYRAVRIHGYASLMDYAAFGLTTIPYAWMSLVDLVGNAICPQYEAVYIVGSSGLDDFRKELETMREESRGSLGVMGEVGRLTPEADTNLVATTKRFTTFGVVEELEKKFSKPRALWIYVKTIGPLHILIAAVPIAVVGGLTGFKPGNSALYQRVWVMIWLVVGSWFASNLSAGAVLEGRPLVRGRIPRGQYQAIVWVYILVLYAAVAIGGYVVVGQMLMEFGVCSLNKAME